MNTVPEIFHEDLENLIMMKVWPKAKVDNAFRKKFMATYDSAFQCMQEQKFDTSFCQDQLFMLLEYYDVAGVELQLTGSDYVGFLIGYLYTILHSGSILHFKTTFGQMSKLFQEVKSISDLTIVYYLEVFYHFLIGDSYGVLLCLEQFPEGDFCASWDDLKFLGVIPEMEEKILHSNLKVMSLVSTMFVLVHEGHATPAIEFHDLDALKYFVELLRSAVRDHKGPIQDFNCCQDFIDMLFDIFANLSDKDKGDLLSVLVEFHDLDEFLHFWNVKNTPPTSTSVAHHLPPKRRNRVNWRQYILTHKSQLDYSFNINPSDIYRIDSSLLDQKFEFLRPHLSHLTNLQEVATKYLELAQTEDLESYKIRAQKTCKILNISSMAATPMLTSPPLTWPSLTTEQSACSKAVWPLKNDLLDAITKELEGLKTKISVLEEQNALQALELEQLRETTTNLQTKYELQDEALQKCLAKSAQSDYELLTFLTLKLTNYSESDILAALAGVLQQNEQYAQLSKEDLLVKIREFLEQDQVCSICLEEISEEEEQKLPCGHIFHKDCMTDWWGRAERCCPMCRMNCSNYSL